MGELTDWHAVPAAAVPATGLVRTLSGSQPWAQFHVPAAAHRGLQHLGLALRRESVSYTRSIVLELQTRISPAF
jgi:hypothetical protein